MPKTLKNRSTPLTKRLKIIIGLSIVVLALLAGGVKWWYIDTLNRTSDLAGIVSIRELIIESARDTKTAVVREPKTGDLYFPEARLFLPVQNVGELTYSVVPGNEAVDLSVTSSLAINRSASELYSATNMEELFKHVPRLQACSRGIDITHKQFEASELGTREQLGMAHLDNGKTLHIYVEKKCPELATTADALTKLRSY